MSDSYTIRNYQAADFDNYTELSIEAERLEPSGRYISHQILRENLERPNYSPEQDLFIVEIAGKFIGYMDVFPELTIGRVILDCWIHPEHRRHGLAVKLLDHAMHRAMQMGARLAMVNVIEDNAAARSLLSKLGFRLTRRFLNLELDLAKVCCQDMEQSAQGSRHLKPGEENELMLIQNRAFTGTWGYNPNTVETIAYHANLGHYSPDDVIIICDADKITGYCWTKTIATGETASSGGKGKILMLGTDPDYRGRGIGKRALLAGLAHLKSKHLQLAELTVDSENEVACALYRSIGFEVATSSSWYEKEINQGTGAR